MKIIKLFLASSSELSIDRAEFQVLIGQLNQDWITRDYFFNLIIWENFIDSMSKDGLQNEYNKVIQDCDIFVLLFFTKVGEFTLQEFEVAFGKFKQKNKPLIYTYFKDALIQTGDIGHDIITLLNFKQRLTELGHYYTRYRSMEDLKWQFGRQLEKLYSTQSKFQMEITDKTPQDEIDAIALVYVNKILSEPINNSNLDKNKLSELISRCSEITLHTIYLLASKMRKENWQYNKDIMERTIPLFESLVEFDKNLEKHYYHGQLAYALKDKRNPDWENAKKLFDTAIDIITYPEHYFAYYYYDFNRAICTIRLDNNFKISKPSRPEIKRSVINDLKTFRKGFEKHFEDILRQEGNKVIKKWMQINNVNF